MLAAGVRETCPRAEAQLSFVSSGEGGFLSLNFLFKDLTQYQE
jgi:hypothetical protein